MSSKTSSFGLFCLPVALVTLGCRVGTTNVRPATETSSYAIQWSPVLQLAQASDIPRLLNRPFGDVFTGTVNGRQATISNCSDYLRLSQQGFKDPNNQESIVLHSDAIDCIALSFLQKAKPAVSTTLGSFTLAPESLALLPPELAPAVSDTENAAAEAADQEGKSWKAYAPAAQVALGKEPSQIEVKQPGWLTRVTEYGRADFTGGGSQQLLIRADYTATEGTYGNSKLFLLGRSTGQARLVLVQTAPIP